jgi:hypothetical protein
MSLSNSKKDSEKSNPEENHPRVFQGTWADNILHELVELGEISVSVAWFAMTIKSLSKKEGCYASNEYLGKKIHRDGKTAERYLRILESKKLLISEWQGRTRILRIDLTRKSNKTRAKAYFKDGRAPEKKERLPKNEESETPQNCGVNSSEMRSQESSEMRSPYREKKGGENKEREEIARSQSSLAAHDLNGFHDEGRLRDLASAKKNDTPIRDKEDIKSLALDIATELYYLLHRNNRITTRNPKMKLWEREINKLLEMRTEKEIRDMLYLYEKHIKDQYWPQIFSASTFVEKFVNLEAARDRLKSSGKDIPNKTTSESNGDITTTYIDLEEDE